MLIYGTGSQTLAETRLDDVPCPKCGRTDQELRCVLRHVHLFWVPLFPFGRTLLTRCRACKSSYTADHLPAPVLDLVRRTSPTSALVLSFIGTIVISLIVLKVMAQGYIDDRHVDQLLASPAVGDVYILAYQPSPRSAKEFGMMRIEEITPDRLRTLSGHIYDTELDARRALRHGDESFDDTRLNEVSRAALEEQRKSGELVSILREPYQD